MKVESSKKNFLYNVAYQVLILIIPFIVTPYVSRTLGADGIGEYSYTYSIISYFMMFAMLGINNYGNRSIARVRDNRKALSRTFKEIRVLQGGLAIISTIIYLLYLAISHDNYFFVGLAQLAYLISCFFDINWFFFGIERFKLTVVRSTIIRILSLVAIFLLVKTPNDVWIYAAILSGSTLISQLAVWPFVGQYVDKVKIKLKDIKKHIKPCLVLFLPVIAVSVYRVIDKTMLGLISGNTELGYYESAEKIVNIPCTFIAALGTVMLPRMSNIYGKGNEKEGVRVIGKSIAAMMFLSFVMTVGLICISQDFTLVFFGADFLQAAPVISLLATTILFLSWGNVIRTQFLIPKSMDKEYTISAFLGAGINIVCNSIFIPRYGALGACIGTIAAEMLVTVYQTFVTRKMLPIGGFLKSIIPFALSSIVAFLIAYLPGFYGMNSYLRIILQGAIIVIIYFALNYKYIYKLIFEVSKRKNKNKRE